MLQLYYAPDNASLIVRLALEEAAVPHKMVLVDRSVQAQKSTQYLALNPTGQIPTLVTPDGVISETGACLLWLVDTHPQAGLGPLPTDATRGGFLRWLFFLSNTVHPDLNRIFYPDQFVPSDARVAHHDRIVTRLQRHYEILDAAARAEPSVFAPPSVVALYLGALLRWSAIYPPTRDRWFDVADYPSLKDVAQALDKRASTRSVAVAEGLGDAPFGQPQPPKPPVGSAL